MRRQGQYADPGANTYGAGRMQHMPGQRMEQNSGPFQGQLEAFTPEREQPYVTSKSERQWRWERDGSKVSNSMTAQMFNEGMFIPDLSHFSFLVEASCVLGMLNLTQNFHSRTSA